MAFTQAGFNPSAWEHVTTVVQIQRVWMVENKFAEDQIEPLWRKLGFNIQLVKLRVLNALHNTVSYDLCAAHVRFPSVQRFSFHKAFRYWIEEENTKRWYNLDDK